MSKDNVKLSKFLSLILRHRPEIVGIKLDEEGWVSIELLMEGMQSKGYPLDLQLLKEIVDEDHKQRYALDLEQGRIRANQGHSVKVNLAYEKQVPPAVLYHGTSRTAVKSIVASSINRGQRHHVHLSEHLEGAWQVAKRRSEPVVLCIDASRMECEGFLFYFSENGVWLCDAVPARFIIEVIEP